MRLNRLRASAISNNTGSPISAVIKKKFSNPQLFEGTKPIPESGKGPLGSVAPGDSGVDITNLPGMGNWAAVASKTRK